MRFRLPSPLNRCRRLAVGEEARRSAAPFGSEGLAEAVMPVAVLASMSHHAPHHTLYGLARTPARKGYVHILRDVASCSSEDRRQISVLIRLTAVLFIRWATISAVLVSLVGF